MPSYKVYVQKFGSRRPVETSVTYADDVKVPSVIEHEGDTYYWIGADISKRTLTYGDWRVAGVRQKELVNA